MCLLEYIRGFFQFGNQSLHTEDRRNNALLEGIVRWENNIAVKALEKEGMKDETRKLLMK